MSNNFAVIQTGGKQYKVFTNDEILVEKINSKPQEKIEFVDMLSGEPVVAKVLDIVKGKKIIIFKFKNKTRYKRVKGHRQLYTKIKIEKIGKVLDEKPVKKGTKKKTPVTKKKATIIKKKAKK